jgi:hypothetical protein
MRFKAIALLGVAAAIAASSPVFAMGSSKGKGGTFAGTVDGVQVSGTYSNGSFSGTYAEASEPLLALTVGLGLLGARYIRRRQ